MPRRSGPRRTRTASATTRRITLARGGGGPEVQREHRRGRRRRPARAGADDVPRRVGRRRAGPGRLARLHLLLDVRRRARPADQPGGRSTRCRPVAVIGCDVADRLFGAADPLDKVMSDRGPRISASIGVSEKKGSSSATRRTSSRSSRSAIFQKMFGSRMLGLQLIVKPKSPDVVQAAMDDATVALRIERRLRPRASRQLRDVHVRHAARHLQHGDQRASSRAHRRRRAVARRRRHRHHEHHADGGERAHARDRPAQGARRAPARHRLADPDRVGDAVDVRRRGRHRASGSSSR